MVPSTRNGQDRDHEGGEREAAVVLAFVRLRNRKIWKGKRP